ncbi:MAG: DUF2271 domain-containing protein [Pseudomonadota bacterium]
MRYLTRGATLVALSLALVTQADGTESLRKRHYDGVLGTSMDLSIAGVEERQANAAFDAAAQEVERLERLLSSYLDDSELSRLNRERSVPRLSPELAELIAKCRGWEKKSDGVFSCKLGAIRARWRDAEQSGEAPDRKALRALARTLRQAELPDPSIQPYALPESVVLDLQGLAKGFIIDRAADAMAKQAPAAPGLSVDIGGDGRYVGAPAPGESWRVGLRGPEAIDTGVIGQVELSDRAVAASGHQSRVFQIGRRQYSQILASRDGWPVFRAAASYVVAESALAADAAATTLAGQAAGDAQAWLEQQSDLESLLVLEGGRQLASAGWRALETSGPEQDSNPVMTLTYTIPKIRASKYRRPYVALWVTNAVREPVRNLLILGEQERWAQENPRWWRAVGRRDEGILEGYARATRRPGVYTVKWDGRDDRGQQLAPGKYRLHLEAAREHGGHTYRTLDFDLTSPRALTLAAEGELGEVAIEWSGSEVEAVAQIAPTHAPQQSEQPNNAIGSGDSE